MNDERDFKTKKEHWSLIVDFLKQHPGLVQNKFNHFDGDNTDVHNLWKDLTQQLNALGHGQKSVEKWQQALGRWKSKVKVKVGNRRLELQKTGGGPPKVPPLTDFEEKLMSLLGWKSIIGDGNCELGLGATTAATTPNLETVPRQSSPSCANSKKVDILKSVLIEAGPPPLMPLNKQRPTEEVKRAG